jgi:selina-4(15),7(11)-diene synthase
MAFFIIGWDNDIFSFHKESRNSSFYLNAVRVVQATAGASLAEALQQVIAQRDRTMCHFLRVQDRYTANLTLRQHEYLKDLATFIRGNQDWGISSARYLNPADPADLPSGFTGDPIDDKAEALGLPNLDSWWDL